MAAAAGTTLLWLLAAWYLCLSRDVYESFADWYAKGLVEYRISYWQALQGAFLFFRNHRWPEPISGICCWQCS